MICQYSVERGRKLFLLGAKPGVTEQMKDNLIRKNPDLQITDTQHGYFDWTKESQQIIEKINQSGADILLVAFGAPLQEKWINKYFDQINCSVQMGVGGLFDFFSGNISRAPRWIRILGLEWVFRLIQEPKRMWRRYILGNPLFIFRLYKWKKLNTK